MFTLLSVMSYCLMVSAPLCVVTPLKKQLVQDWTS